VDERLYFKPPDYWITYFELSALAYECYTNKEFEQLLTVSKERKLFLKKAKAESVNRDHLRTDWKQIYSDLITANYYLGNLAEFKNQILEANIHAIELTYEVKALELMYQYKYNELRSDETKIFAWDIEQLALSPAYNSIDTLRYASVCPDDISKCIHLLLELLGHLLIENGFELTVNRSVNIQIITKSIDKLSLIIDPFRLAS
jgi:hypothetical protein